MRRRGLSLLKTYNLVRTQSIAEQLKCHGTPDAKPGLGGASPFGPRGVAEAGWRTTGSPLDNLLEIILQTLPVVVARLAHVLARNGEQPTIEDEGDKPERGAAKLSIYQGAP